MVNQEFLAGKWNELRGKLKSKWGRLSDDDVRTFDGDVDQLVGRIQQKTGESREIIEQFLSQAADEGSQFFAGVRDKVEHTAEQAAEAARDGYDTFRQAYADAEKAVQGRPGQAVALAFGLGLLSGLGVALLLRDRGHQSRLSQGRSAAEQLGKQILNALANMVPDSLTKGPGG